MYNTDFVIKYLDKDDGIVVIADNLFEVSYFESFFFFKFVFKLESIKKCLFYYYEFESLWYFYVLVGIDVNTKTCRNFLFNVMYNFCVLSIICDDRIII